MRIAVVNNFFPPRVGGSAHIADGLARHYAAAGHEVMVITTAHAGAPPLEKRDGIAICRLPSWTLPESRLSFNFDITFALKARNLGHVYRLLNRFHPDVIHQHGQFFDLTWQSALWAKRHHVPTVLTVHTRLSSPRMIAAGIFRTLDELVVNPILKNYPPTRVIALDVMYDTYIRERYGYGSDVIRYVPVGIELAPFIDPEPIDIRKKYGLGDGPVALSLGHVIPLRDRVGVVKALPQILERHPDFKLLVVGGIFYWRYLELAAQLGVDHAIVSPGKVPRDEIAGICAASDFEIHDLQGIGVGIATLEAMAAGTPAIFAVRPDVWPNAPLVNEEHALIVPVHDTAAVQAAMLRLIEDEELRARVGAGGRRYVFENFEFGKVGDENLAVLEEAVAAGPVTQRS